MTGERIGFENWWAHEGHVGQYRWAATKIRLGETVNDIASGIGYGAELIEPAAHYVGYDKPEVARLSRPFPGGIHGCDMDDPAWMPFDCDVTLTFGTLEHLKDPWLVAQKITETTGRAICVSVPTRPTKALNVWHLHDFTVDEIPPMFSGFRVVECWDHESELSHCWYFERD